MVLPGDFDVRFEDILFVVLELFSPAIAVIVAIFY